LILEHLLGVEEQSPDERAFAVVDGARGRKTQQAK
jgi:hypothetical protein